jgi:hypothetical protein
LYFQPAPKTARRHLKGTALLTDFMRVLHFFPLEPPAFARSRPEFGFISLKGWQGTILMNGC